MAITRKDVTAEMIAEQQDLLNSGDLDLDEKCEAFEAAFGRKTTLNQAELLIIAAMEDDDYGAEWWNEKILEAEADKPSTEVAGF